MDIERFISQRHTRWDRFEKLLDRAERSEAIGLGHEALQELLRLYRQLSADLNQARSYTANPRLIERLNHLVGRGYAFLYRGGHGPDIRESARHFLTVDGPAAYRQERHYVLTAAAIFTLGALIGFVAVLLNPAHATELIPSQFFTASPKERVERIESSAERISNLDEAAMFGAQLYTHNIKVAFLAFSLGALSLLGGVYILFYNGLILGAVAASYFLDGVSIFFLAWVGPHGALELPAIIFAGAAGLRMGRALLLPGHLTPGASLRRALPSVWRMMILTMLILVGAGIIEGSFSQFTARSFPYPLKIGVAALLFVTLMGYLFWRRLDCAEAVS